MTDTTADYLALRRDVGAVWLPRDIVVAEGDDTFEYLHGQVTQDVKALADGESRLSFLLEPQGKVIALFRITRRSATEAWIDTDAGAGEALVASLDRFKLRSKVAFTARPDWRCLALRGPRAPEVAPSDALDADWPSLPGRDVLGPDPQVPDGVPVCGAEAWDAVRIESGIPVSGVDVDGSTIPQETGLQDRAIDFAKGCYRGQELVERIHSRGHVNQRLAGVVLTENVLPPPGAELVGGDGKVRGRLTSVAESLDRRAPVALAYVRRELEPGDDVEVRWEGGSATARVESLPLV